jgi:hypothetical protein
MKIVRESCSDSVTNEIFSKRLSEIGGSPDSIVLGLNKVKQNLGFVMVRDWRNIQFNIGEISATGTFISGSGTIDFNVSVDLRGHHVRGYTAINSDLLFAIMRTGFTWKGNSVDLVIGWGGYRDIGIGREKHA